MITKGERVELRSLIRQRFKVLRAEVEQRQSELHAELEQRIGEKFAEQDKTWADAAFLISEAALEANRKANDIVRNLMGPDWQERRIVTAIEIGKPLQERQQLRREGMTRIDATVKAAKVHLDQQEVDLLTRLVSGALESEEARSFLGEIPTVSALVPVARLLELERSLKAEDGAS